MHHITLNRAWAHDGNFNHQIVECSWAQAWQHVHLCAAFHLKHAERIAFAKHVVDGFVLARQCGERQLLAIIMLRLMRVNEIEGFADTGKHAK